ncbi:unknown [Coraliomargarita sp. CAG:312]|nr:unknown [Coraliomargarita sp. CAG:312]
MSGLVQWSSCAKRKPLKKKPGAKPNPRRQRLLAARKRKIRASAVKASRKLREVAVEE